MVGRRGRRQAPLLSSPPPAPLLLYVPIISLCFIPPLITMIKVVAGGRQAWAAKTAGKHNETVAPPQQLAMLSEKSEEKLNCRWAYVVRQTDEWGRSAGRRAHIAGTSGNVGKFDRLL